MVTTRGIKVDDEVYDKLKEKKKYPQEFFNDVLRRILKLNKKKNE